VLGASIGGSQPNTGQAAALWMGVIGFLALLAGAVMVLHGFRPRRSEPS
jgi:LPXTG-motif cell wall-anchored protein